MGKEELTPSESEWQVMEVLWESGEALTSSEVIGRIKPEGSMNPKMVRVLMNRLCQKGILAYRVDEKDSRIYHYYPLKTKSECQREKSSRFIESYFAGNQMGAVAALIGSAELSGEEIEELEHILQNRKKEQREEFRKNISQRRNDALQWDRKGGKG